MVEAMVVEVVVEVVVTVVVVVMVVMVMVVMVMVVPLPSNNKEEGVSLWLWRCNNHDRRYLHWWIMLFLWNMVGGWVRKWWWWWWCWSGLIFFHPSPPPSTLHHLLPPPSSFRPSTLPTTAYTVNILLLVFSHDAQYPSLHFIHLFIFFPPTLPLPPMPFTLLISPIVYICSWYPIPLILPLPPTPSFPPFSSII